MILEKNLLRGYDLSVPAELLELAALNGRIRIVVDEHEIRITRAKHRNDLYQQMLGLGKDIFETDSVTLQRNIRAVCRGQRA